MTAIGNALSGVFVNGPYNTIGGTTPGTGNLISGNGYDGIWINGGKATTVLLNTNIYGGPAHDITVQGNLIGTNANASAALPNARDGIEVISATNNTIGDSSPTSTNPKGGNVILGNSRYGVEIVAGSSKNLLNGNAIVTSSLPNQLGGVSISSDSTLNVVVNPRSSSAAVGVTWTSPANLPSGPGGPPLAA
jgi:titin